MSEKIIAFNKKLMSLFVPSLESTILNLIERNIDRT
jgi:hypothetical protein